jgi:tetratricopeptide (TPR) repeat protein
MSTPPSNKRQVTIPEAMEIAVTHHRAGRLQDAEAIYRQVLATYPNVPGALHMLGVVLFQSGRPEEGIELIRKALVLQPNFPEALANLGHILRERGRTGEAVECCRKAVALAPNLAEAYINLGSALQSQRNFEEAVEHHRKAIELRPDFPDAYTNLGNALQSMGRHTESAEIHRRALELKPDFAEGHNNLGAALHSMGKIDEAIEHFNRAVQLKPHYPEALSNLGFSYHAKGMFDEAIKQCRRSIDMEPNNPDAYNNLGNSLQEKGEWTKAKACFQKSLEQRPDHIDAMNNLANCLHEMGNSEEAVIWYRKAIKLRPVFAKAYGNLGNALRALGKIEESIEICRKAVEMQPTLEEAHVNLGTALHMAGRFEEGVDACRRAIELRNEFPDAHKDLSLMLLGLGDFETGWREYEWRLKLPRYYNAPANFSRPMWDGSDPAGRTILIHAEQGLGDSIHFSRYLPLLARKGAKIIFECQAELTRLMRQTPMLKEMQIVARPLPGKTRDLQYDVHAPLLSLPLLLAEPKPSAALAQPPYMFPDETLLSQWRERMGKRQGLRVGLAWAGSKTNKSDRHRSMSLTMLAPLAREGIEFFNLQLGPPGEQAANPPPGMNLINHAAAITDFADTAALLTELDLVVSVDTAVVHLAGAMGKPVWVLVHFAPDFRWLLKGDTTPWYPSMRLFRQTRSGNWSEVIDRIATALEMWKKENSGKAEGC